MKTRTALLNGKPYAGNPHVRFDEGEVASAKPRRGSLLYKMTNNSYSMSCVLMSLALLSVPSWGATSVTTTASGITYEMSPWDKSDEHETKSGRLAWPGKSLVDIVAIKATVAGAWIGGGYSADGLIYDRTDMSFKVQFQCEDTSWGGKKVVRAQLDQTAEGVAIKLTGAAVMSGSVGQLHPDSIFDGSGTPIGSDGYGVKGVEAYGDVYDVSEFPQPASGGVIINGGTLRVHVLADVESSVSISGTGRLCLFADAAAESREVSYSTVLPKNSSWVTVITDAELKDVVLTGGTIGGSWVDGTRACTPYRATTQSDGSVIVQLQRLSWGDSRCVRVQLRQSGTNIQAKGLDSWGKAGDHLGEDATKWEKNSAFTDAGYQVASLIFSRTDRYGVTLRGTKAWKGGTTVDGVRLNVRDEILPDRSTVKVVNGGMLGLSVANAYDHFPHNTYDLSEGAQLLINGFDAVNCTDAIVADAASVRIVSDNRVYLNTMTLKNGATVSGYPFRVGNTESAVWRTSGEVPIVVSAGVETVRSTNEKLTVDAGADVTFSAIVCEMSGKEGLPLVKTGAGKLTFGNSVVTTGSLTLDGGMLSVGNALTAAGLILRDDTTLEIAVGRAAQFGASAGLVWAQGKVLTVMGNFDETDQSLRVGTDANGLTRTQAKSIRMGEKKGVVDDKGWVHLLLRGFALMLR